MNQYIPNGTPLSEYEREILTILMEECAEVIRAASKITRFGKGDVFDGISNTDELNKEVGDLKAIIQKAFDAGLLDPKIIELAVVSKKHKLERYMQHHDESKSIPETYWSESDPMPWQN